MPAARIDAVIFDMYGTLCHRGPDPLRRLIDACEISPADYQRVRRALLTQRFPDAVSIARFLGAPAGFDIAAIERDLADAVGRVALYDDALPALEALKEQGLRIGLISNLGTAYRAPFHALGLDRYITEPIFSCDVGTLKPEPGIYRLACASLGVRAERTLMVGDSPRNDVEGARSAGLQAVLLDRTGSSGILTPTQIIDLL